jgi:lipoprotein-anchoring transpeptidase ErfK/SrfK
MRESPLPQPHQIAHARSAWQPALATLRATCDDDHVGQHRRPAGRAVAPSSPKRRVSLARPITIIATLVAGFVAAQLFLPTGAGLSAAEKVGIASSAVSRTSPAPAPVAAEAVPNVVAASTSTKSAATTAKLPHDSGKGRRVVYSVKHQRVWLVGGKGVVKRTYLVSGRLSQPPPGHFRVYSKSRWTSSTVSAETMQYMVRFTHGARTGTPIGFHSIPRDYSGHAAQSVHDLGKPLSAGCIRQRLRDAAYLWRFAPVGTTVVVTH